MNPDIRIALEQAKRRTREENAAVLEHMLARVLRQPVVPLKSVQLLRDAIAAPQAFEDDGGVA
jgi:hypothetical protein